MAGWRETPWGRRELPGGRICRRLLFSTCRITAAGYWVAFALLALTASQAVAASPNEATTSREARNEAASAIPYGELTEDAQRRIAAVIDKPSAYRRLPIETIECDPSLYIFLIRNPEVVVNIWDLMGVTDLSIQRTGPFTFASSDGVGTVSNVELIYGTQDVHLYFAEGVYDGPLLPSPLRGRCVMFLRTGYGRGPAGKPTVTSQLDVFMQVDHAAIDVLTKTLHPLFGKTADINFFETTQFIGRLSRTAEKNGDGMLNLAGRLNKVDPAIRQQFGSLASTVPERMMVAAGSIPPSASTASSVPAPSGPVVQAMRTATSENANRPNRGFRILPRLR